MKIKSITRVYIQRIRPHAAEELNWFAQKPTLKSAVEFSALAINSKGKRYSHQRRLKKATLEKSKRILLANLNELKKSQSFDDLFLLIEHLLSPIEGAGELYIYDTALRIGAKMNLLPTKIYLHAGTRVGAKALGFNSKFKILEKQNLPTGFQELEPHEIEDVLCIFKSNLEKVDINSINDDMLQRSWCR